MSCPATINTSIDDAIEVLQALKALLALGTPSFEGWHVNPIDGTCVYYRTNQIYLSTGQGTAINFRVDPSTLPETVHAVSVEFAPY